ncbi:MAG: tetratricopeptide repeat protein [Calditrichaceae bacterium]
MKFKILVILLTFVLALHSQDRRKVGLIPTVNEAGKQYDWVSYGLEYLLYNKLSVISAFYVLDKNNFRDALDKAGYDYKNIPDGRLVYRIGKDTGVQVTVSGRYKIAANTISLEVVFSNAFNGTEILRTNYQEPLSNIFQLSGKVVNQLVTLTGVGVSDKEQHLLGLSITNSVSAFENFIRAYIEEATNTGRREAVIGLFKRAIREDPNFWEAYYNLGIVYYNTNRYNMALDQFNKVINALPRFDKPYYGRGLIYEQQGRYDDAIADFKKVTEFNPNDYKPYYYLGKLSIKNSEYGKAAEYLETAKEINPEFAPTFYELGNIHYNQDNYRKAIGFYKTATELDGQNAQYFLILGDCYYRSNIYYSALEAIDKSIDLDSKNALAYFLKGITVYKEAVMEELIEAFLDLLSGGQTEQQGSNILGTGTDLSFKTKKAAIDPVKRKEVYDKMADSFGKAVKYKPNFMEATFNLALTYHEMGNLAQAERYYKAALQIKPDLIRAYMQLSELYTTQGKKDLALDQYRKVFTLEPSIILDQQTLGKEYDYINIYELFRKELDDKLELNPNDPKNNLILAKIFKAQGHYGKAANVLRRVLTQSPNNNEAKALLDSIKNYGS